MQAVVSGITNVSFWWRVSSETNFDFLQFYTHGTLARSISGEVNWQSNSYKLGPQTNTLMWRYTKSIFSNAKGLDAGFVDQVVFTQPQKAFPFTLGVPQSLPDATIQIPVSGEIGCTCQMTFSTNFVDWTVLSNFVTTGVSTIILDSGASNSVMRFYRTLSP